MPDTDEIRWLKSTANELNNILQVISESVKLLASLCEGDPERDKCLNMVQSSVDRAGQISRLLLDHAGERESVQVPAFPSPGQMAKAAPVPVPSQEARPLSEGGDIPIANPTGSKELILIVDDEVFVTLLAQRVLTDEGYRVVKAKDGFEAIDIYKRLRDKINLVILDFTMPIMDGSEVFDELRLINPRVPVMLSSGFTEQERLKWMLAKGLRGFIPKPYTQQKLLLQVRSTLDALKNEMTK